MSDLICMVAIGLMMFVLLMAMAIGTIPKDTYIGYKIRLSGVATIIIICISTAYTLRHIETTYENVDKNIKIASVQKLKNDDEISYIITTDDNDEYDIAYKRITYNENERSFIHVDESKTDEYKITGSTTYRIESIFGHSMKEEKAYDVIVEVPSDVYNIYKYGNNAQLTDVKL